MIYIPSSYVLFLYCSWNKPNWSRKPTTERLYVCLNWFRDNKKKIITENHFMSVWLIEYWDYNLKIFNFYIDVTRMCTRIKVKLPSYFKFYGLIQFLSQVDLFFLNTQSSMNTWFLIFRCAICTKRFGLQNP